MNPSFEQPPIPSKKAFARSGRNQQTFPVDRYFAEEFIREETIREIEEAKARVARAVGVDVSAVEIKIDMPFLVTI